METSQEGRKCGVLEVSATLILILWRLLTQPISELWRDWILLISLYLALTAIRGATRQPSSAAIAVMAYLLGFYTVGQIPHILIVLGLAS